MTTEDNIEKIEKTFEKGVKELAEWVIKPTQELWQTPSSLEWRAYDLIKRTLFDEIRNYLADIDRASDKGKKFDEGYEHIRKWCEALCPRIKNVRLKKGLAFEVFFWYMTLREEALSKEPWILHFLNREHAKAELLGENGFFQKTLPIFEVVPSLGSPANFLTLYGRPGATTKGLLINVKSEPINSNFYKHLERLAMKWGKHGGFLYVAFPKKELTYPALVERGENIAKAQDWMVKPLRSMLKRVRG